MMHEDSTKSLSRIENEIFYEVLYLYHQNLLARHFLGQVLVYLYLRVFLLRR